jgi:microcystin degradation protein MlrC
MRIAVAGIATESCTFSTLPTTLEDFEVLVEGALLQSGRYPFLPALGAEFVPALYARALPGGPVAAEAYRHLKDELLALLASAGSLDGVYLDLHGAMNVAGMDDAEGDLAAAVRKLVGPGAFIAASMDLHGNLSARYVAQVDIITAYRTAPHVDTLETRAKACRMLVDSLARRVRPQVAWVPIPVILPGERTSTEWEPGSRLWRSLADVDRVPGVLDASLFVGYVWADEPRAHAAAVVTGTDLATIQAEARRLARAYWDARADFGFGVAAGSIDECIQWALEAPEPSVFISDSGDNPTAGGVGDVPILVERLLAHRVGSALVASIPDPEAVAVCAQAGVGAVVDVSLGGKLDTVHGRPLALPGKVLYLAHGDPVGGTQALLQVDSVKVIVTERRKPFHHMADFHQLGVAPLDHKIVVVKVGYLVPELKRAAPQAFLALSPGAVDQHIERLPYRRVERPIYPLDEGMAWSI